MNYTEQMEGALFNYWDEDYTSEEKVLEFLNMTNTFSTFGEALQRFVLTVKADEDIINAEDYLKNELKKHDISFNRNTLKNWFSGKRPKKGDQSREHMYKIGFALELSVNEVSDLFRKVYYDRPFNMRNPKEFVYYYCFMHQYTYQHAQNLLEQIRIDNEVINEETRSTRLLTNDVMGIEDDCSIVDYILQHPHNFQLQSTSAKKILDNLLNEVRAKEDDREKLENMKVDKRCGIVTQECNHHPEFIYKYTPLKNTSLKNKSLTSISTMLDIILDINFVKEKEERDFTIFKNATLPDEISQCFPNKHVFSKENPTFEELRKMIILLFSYKFWFKKEYEEDSPDLDDYMMQLDGLLQEAELPQLYYGNPYDWLFIYCTLGNEEESSLDKFRSILAEVFTDEI